MRIKIKNLRLRTIIGVTELERKDRQDVIVNIDLEFDGSRATQTDNVDDSVNYRTITKRVIKEVEEAHYHLLEHLTDHVLKVIMADERVLRATVEVDKPNALRFADSVSIICSAERKP